MIAFRLSIEQDVIIWWKNIKIATLKQKLS